MKNKTKIQKLISDFKEELEWMKEIDNEDVVEVSGLEESAKKLDSLFEQAEKLLNSTFFEKHKDRTEKEIKAVIRALNKL